MRKFETIIFEKDDKNENIVKETLLAAKKRAIELDIKDIVIASTLGDTAKKALDHFDPNEFNIVVVTHSTGFIKKGEQEMHEDARQYLLKSGCKVLTCTHAFAGPERGIRGKLRTYGPVDILASFLRSCVAEGFKVVLEIALMAADAGQIPDGKPCICIAGTGRGCDTAAVIDSSDTSHLYDLRVCEIICKPI